MPAFYGFWVKPNHSYIIKLGCALPDPGVSSFLISSGIIYSMKTLKEIQQTLRIQQPILKERYGVQIVGVFGSYVRHEQRPDSDLDILIELDRPPKISLIGLVELEDYLSQVLGVPVDIAIKTNLKRRIGQRILQEVVPL
jgi:uncharacterized protein